MAAGLSSPSVNSEQVYDVSDVNFTERDNSGEYDDNS